MSADISINFAGATAKSNSVGVVLAGCTVSPSADGGVTVAMASALTNITIVSNLVTIATALNAQFSGSLAMAIGWTSEQQPSVTLNNLQNPTDSPATVTWPTASAPQIQILTPGNPMPLTGIVNN
jgi:hypothetical protein